MPLKMNRWVLLEHRIFGSKLEDLHYDFLIEDELDCLTWKMYEIPSFSRGYIEIVKQANHRLVWLSRVEYNLSKKRGLVKRIDYGTFINSSVKSDSQDVKFILTGNLLNGILSITGNLCRLTQYN